MIFVACWDFCDEKIKILLDYPDLLIAIKRLEGRSTYFHYLIVQLGCFQNFPEPIMPFLYNNLFYNTHTDMCKISTKADTILVSQF